MGTSRGLRATLGLILAGFAGTAGSAPARASERNATLTVLVRNYAQVDATTLMDAEKVAAEIFSKAGVQTRWVDADKASQTAAALNSTALSDIQLFILPPAMAGRLQVNAGTLGFAPGSGPDRHVVYAFYSGIVAYARTESRASKKLVDPALILGHVVAHEIGHVLLNLGNHHSSTGIMRAQWNPTALDDARRGYLVFTARQAEAIRADLARRNGQRQQDELASLLLTTNAP